MARPKLVEDSIILELIKKYFNEECHNNIKKLRTSEIIKYINNNGYPDYPVTTLRRTQVVMDYIEELKNMISDDKYITSVSYQTIDAALLVNSNRSKETLIKVISERDSYYKTVADSAAQAFEMYNKLKKKYETEKECNTLLTEHNTKLEKLVSENETKIKMLTAELKSYKSVIETYVYPEIANELLIKEGAVRKTDSLIIEDALENNLIAATTNIKEFSKSGSSIIEGLFNV